MNWANKCLQLVEELPADYTETLISKLRSGDRSSGFPNPRYREGIEAFLQANPVPPNELAAMLEVALCARGHQPSIDLVWTGPTTSVLPVRQTEQVLLEVI